MEEEGVDDAEKGYYCVINNRHLKAVGFFSG
jgi:hypothetical protein